MKVGIIVLAAGASSRMGQSKQLLAIENEPLLFRATRAALNSKATNVVVVLGANAVPHASVISTLPVTVVFHEHWASGMGGSMKAGLKSLLTTLPDADAAMIILCDQPLLTSLHLDKLIDDYASTSQPIVASRYGGSSGVPALFGRSMFPVLLELNDHEGAKKVIQQNALAAFQIDFPEGEIDLDTPEEYQNFIQSGSGLDKKRKA